MHQSLILRLLIEIGTGNNSAGFTLAVAGVVASMTIPGLIKFL